MAIGLNGTNQFKLYLHERGEEYFLHYDYWPYVPFTHHSKQEDIWVDVNLKKEVFEEELYETNENIFVHNQVHETACEKSDYFGKIFLKIFRTRINSLFKLFEISFNSIFNEMF